MEINIEANKERFINLIKTIDREGACIDDLLWNLNNSDFFVSPASTKYHLAVEGGLCQHCLDVYDNLKLLSEAKGVSFDESSLVIVSLLHDLSKLGLYKKDIRNVKVRSDIGSKHDELGRYDWIAEPCYSINEEHFIYSSKEVTSEYLVHSFIPLTLEESVAILHCYGGQGKDSAQDNIHEVFKTFPLALFLHMADMMSVYIDEK